MIVPYSTAFFPPLPVLEIGLSSPASQEWHGPYVAQLDSGADFTVVPMELIRAINPPVVRPATLSSPWRERRAVHLIPLFHLFGAPPSCPSPSPTPTNLKSPKSPTPSARVG